MLIVTSDQNIGGLLVEQRRELLVIGSGDVLWFKSGKEGLHGHILLTCHVETLYNVMWILYSIYPLVKTTEPYKVQNYVYFIPKSQ